ncbi:MAG TPA: extracellular solute-binding protein [Candidatus Acidoferrales bacterium]|nr:extracellular solute-binding protein [Candidatus Acidoferrales bacterium]
MKRIVFATLAAFVIPAAAFAADSVLREKAEAEGKVVWYTTIGSSDCKALSDRFRQQYPKIEVQCFRTGGPQLVERIFAEARAGRHLWDVFMNSGIYTNLLTKKNMLAVYVSPEAQFYREGFKDPKGTWVSMYTNYAVAGYNTRLVAREEAPKTYADLLKPIWKNQLGMDSKSYEWFAVVSRGLGDDKEFRFMRALAATGVQLRNGRELVAQLVAAGEFKIGLNSYSHNFESLKQQGAPVEWVPLNPVYANIHPVGLSPRAPHPNAGKLFIDFLLSKAGQEVLRSLKRIPDRIDTPPDPPRLIEGIKPAFGTQDIYDDFNRYIKLFNEIFGAG